MLDIALKFCFFHNYFFRRKVFIYIVDHLHDNTMKISPFRAFIIIINVVVHVIDQVKKPLVLIVN